MFDNQKNLSGYSLDDISTKLDMSAFLLKKDCTGKNL